MSKSAQAASKADTGGQRPPKSASENAADKKAPQKSAAPKKSQGAKTAR